MVAKIGENYQELAKKCAFPRYYFVQAFIQPENIFIVFVSIFPFWEVSTWYTLFEKIVSLRAAF